MKTLLLITLFFLFSLSNESKESHINNLSKKENIACVGFISLNSNCIQSDTDTFAEFSWFLIIDTNCDPITHLKLEIDQESYHCNYENHFSQYFIDYNGNPDSY